MSRLRAFIAVELSPDVRGRAKKLIRALSQTGADVKWVDPQNLHLTLKFLGDVETNDTPELCRAVAAAANQCTAFDFTCLGVGAFPRPERPRTIWLGVDEGAEEFAKLAEVLDEELAAIGYPREPRRFVPHITLGRARDDGEGFEALAEAIAAEAEFAGGASDVSEVTVFSSSLGRSGPSYEALSHIPLAE